MVASLAADALGVTIAAGEGGGTGSHQGIGVGFRTDELGQRSLSHRPPLEAAVETLLHFFEVAPDGKPVLRSIEGRVQPAQPFESGLQCRLGASTGPVPGLEVVEQGADLEERVNRQNRRDPARTRSLVTVDQCREDRAGRLRWTRPGSTMRNWPAARPTDR